MEQEHEEGEITDSESESEQAPSNKGKDAMSLMSGLETAARSSMSEVESCVSQAVTMANPRVSAAPPATSTQPSSYDSRNSTVFRNVPRHHSSSDESSDSLSDEDTDLWRCKKAKYFSSSKREDSMVTELPDEIKSPPRNNGFSKFVQPSGSVKRKINNVWGSVLTEQCLTENMKSVEVYKNPELVNSDRKVEKYDFTNAYDDDRPDAIDIFPKTTNDPFENVIASDHEGDYLSHRQGTKRKRKAKDRIGRRHVKDILNDYPPVKTLSEISDEPVTVEDSEQDIVSYIAKELFERKVELIAKIVRVVGKEKALEVFEEVLKIEENGGMLTNDGFRRRAPGGVYFTLMKTDKGLTAEQHDEIFAEEERNYKEWCKKAKKERRNKARKMKRMYKKLPQSKLLETGHKNDECSTSNRKGEDDMNSDNSSGEDGGNMDLMDSVNDRQTNKGAMITDIGKEESGADYHRFRTR
ncbi:hypothetical protein FSP39_021569 [Pinctada imbricata]|uniref:Phosphorylated adapter RNA export protein n=1 Tax=Pinctada imbricata TaxID=66713 RepID=A0AA88YFY7_PINIB|nr:hypothetical protein FSP39_021569 [Pinctada imbricata]